MGQTGPVTGLFYLNCCSICLVCSLRAGELLSKVEVCVRESQICNPQFQPHPNPAQKNPDTYLVFHTRTAFDTITVQSTLIKGDLQVSPHSRFRAAVLYTVHYYTDCYLECSIACCFNLRFSPCIIIVNHFYCLTNALNYTNLEVKIYVV